MRHNRLILTKLFTIVNHIKQDQKSVYLSDQQLTGPGLVNHNGFMPSKNRVKTYIENGYYHIYNRGVEKRDIFIDDQDYRAFLHFLKNYLSPPPKLPTHPAQEVTGSGPVKPGNYSYSSYPYYLGKKRAPWINPKPIISFFKSARRRNLRDFFSYQSFVEDYLEDPRELLGSLAID